MKTTFLLLTLLASMTMGSLSAQATVIARFDPLTTHQEVGSTFDVRIVADVPAEEAIVAWGFRLLYDPSQLSLNAVSTPLDWDLVSLNPDMTYLTALLLPDLNSPDPGLSGAGLLLATLNFTCIAPGTSLLDIAIDAPDPNQGFVTFYGEFAEWEAVPGAITQTYPIPEPETSVLLGIGLAGIIFISCTLHQRCATAANRDPGHQA